MEITVKHVKIYVLVDPFRPHRFPSSTRYFPMILETFLKISSKFGEHVQIQMHT